MSNEKQHPLESAPAQAPTIFDPRDRIVIGTPCYGGMINCEFAMAWMKTTQYTAWFAKEGGGAEELPIVADWVFLKNESHIDRARNNIVNRFMKTKYNYLFTWDADVEAEATTIARLWFHAMNGHKIVGGCYANKSVVPQFAVNSKPGAVRDPQTGLIEVHDLGTGCKMHHRSTFEALEKDGRAPEFRLGDNHPDRATLGRHRAYFKSGVVWSDQVKDYLWLSEDYYFDHEMRELGIKLHVDTGIQLKHHGTQAFPVTPKEAFAAAQEFRRIKHPDCPTVPV